MLTIQDLLNDKRVFLDVPAADKLAALKTVVHLLAEAGQINADAEADLYRRLDEREQLSTTALGEGIAIPHAYFEQIPEPMLIFARLSKGVDFDAPDDRPVDKIFMLLGGKRDHTQHLMIMARLSRMLKDTGFRQTLDTAGQPGAVLDAVRDVESRH